MIQMLRSSKAARRAGARHRPQRATKGGALLFVHAYRMGLEGIVSKTAERALPVGAIRDWLNVKNSDSSAMVRAREADW
jgi:hypothetical protein